MKNKYNIKSLINLYISYIFQKGTIIILIGSLLLMTLFLVIVSNPWLPNTDYLLSYKDIHRGYLEQGIFIIQVFNSVIISAIVIQIIINSNSFDTLFISYIPRKNIVIVKLLSLLIILLALILFEVLILFIIPLFRYSMYKMEIENIIIIPYLLICITFELSISILLSIIFQSIFIPMTVLFTSVIIKVISSIKGIKEIFSYFIPIIYIDNMNSKLDIKAMLVGIVLSILFLFIYYRIYKYKDIK